MHRGLELLSILLVVRCSPDKPTLPLFCAPPITFDNPKKMRHQVCSQSTHARNFKLVHTDTPHTGSLQHDGFTIISMPSQYCPAIWLRFTLHTNAACVLGSSMLQSHFQTLCPDFWSLHPCILPQIHRIFGLCGRTKAESAPSAGCFLVFLGPFGFECAHT